MWYLLYKKCVSFFDASWIFCIDDFLARVAMVTLLRGKVVLESNIWNHGTIRLCPFQGLDLYYTTFVWLNLISLTGIISKSTMQPILDSVLMNYKSKLDSFWLIVDGLILCLSVAYTFIFSCYITKSRQIFRVSFITSPSRQRNSFVKISYPKVFLDLPNSSVDHP